MTIFVRHPGQSIKNLCTGGAMLAMCAVALLVWKDIAFYPDEVAMRMSSGRYFADHGIANGLYPLCQSRIHGTPFLFVLPAWILGAANELLTPATLRILPFASALALLGLMIWISIRRGTPAAALLAMTALIGVAGSGLVLARPEFLEVMLLGFGLGATHFLPILSRTGRVAMAAAVLVVLLLALYTHLQALLFLPFALFVIYQLLRRGLGNLVTAILVGVLGVALIYTTWTFQQISCSGHPLVEESWKNMQLSAFDVQSVSVLSWLSAKFELYVVAFYYQPSYGIKYLPGFATGNSLLVGFAGVLNQFMRAILIANLMGPVLLLIGVGARTVANVARGKRDASLWIEQTLGRSHAISLGLLTIGLVILFLDDPIQNFYRSFFLNLWACSILCVFFSRVPLGRFKLVLSTYAALGFVMVVCSVALNAAYFSVKIKDGYVGPSVSSFVDWSSVRSRTVALAKACHVNLAHGRLVIDDLTYEPVKRSPTLYPTSYLALEALLEKSDLEKRFTQLKPYAFIGRCGSPHPGDAAHPGDRSRLYSDKELCCYDFGNDPAP